MAQDAPAPPVLKPLPDPDANSAAFWGAAREHRLSIQYCAACRLYIHPPVGACKRCDSASLEIRPVSGKASLYSFTIMHDKSTKGFEALVPYVVGVVELVEQERLLMVTNVVGAALDEVRIGMPLEVVFEDVTPDCALPEFRPVRG